jgi:hypothetical protein
LDTLEKYLTEKVNAVIDLSEERESRNNERFQSSEKAVTTAFAAAKEAVAAAMAASEKAVTKAEAASEKRQDASNEIRAAMIDQQKLFADKAQSEFRFNATDKRLDGIDLMLSRQEGRGAGVSASWGYLVAAFGVGLTIAMIVFYVLSTIKLAGH